MSLFRKIFICLFIIGGLLSGASCGTSNSSEPVIQAVICGNITQNGQPVLMTTSFSPDVDTIYCSVRLDTVDTSSKVRADWYVVDSQEAGIKEMLIGSEKLDVSAQYMVFSFVRADSLLPRGEYEVRIYYDDKLAQTAGFKIEGQAEPSKVKLSDLSVSTNLDPISGRALDKIETIPVNSPVIYCTAKAEEAGFNTRATAEWVYIKGALEGFENKTIASQTQKLEDRDYFCFSLEPATGLFPAGEYRVNLLINEIVQASITFNVVEPGKIQGPVLSQAVIYSIGDNQTINASGIFPLDIGVIYSEFNIYNAPAGTKIKVQWYYDNDDNRVLYDQMFGEDEQTIEGTVRCSNNIKLNKDKVKAGDYSVRILINDVEMLRIPFKMKSS